MGYGGLVVMRPPGNAAALEKRRRKAIELLQQKMLIVDVAAAVHASTSSVKRWRDAYLAQGDAGLNSIPNHGRPSRLNERQRKQLTRTLLKGAGQRVRQRSMDLSAGGPSDRAVVRRPLSRQQYWQVAPPLGLE